MPVTPHPIPLKAPAAAATPTFKQPFLTLNLTITTKKQPGLSSPSPSHLPALSTLAAVSAVSAASLSYITALTSLDYDAHVLASLVRSKFRYARLQRRDRVNLFYALEDVALEARTAGLTFLVYLEEEEEGGEEVVEEVVVMVGEGEGGEKDVEGDVKTEKKKKIKRRRTGEKKKKEKTWTFKETYDCVLKCAGWLRQVVGVDTQTGPNEQGEHGQKQPEGEDGKESKEVLVIALDFTNTPMFIFLWLAVWSLGAVPAFVNSHLGRKGFVQSVRTAGAKVAIVEDEVWRNMFRVEGDVEGGRPVGEKEALMEMQRELTSSSVSTEGGGGKAGGQGQRGVRIIHFDQKVESSMPYQASYRAQDSVRGNLQPRDPAILISTSGTTGPPKQAIASWYKLHTGGRFAANWLSLRPATHRKPDRFYCCMPLYHSSAAILGLVNCLMNTTTIVLGHGFGATGFWSDVRQTRATVIQYVGEMCRYLLSCPTEVDPHDPSQNLDQKHSVRVAFGNGLQPDVWGPFKARFGIETIAEFYSATEAMHGAWNLSRNHLSAGAVGRIGSLGALLIGRMACIIQVDLQSLTPLRDASRGGLCVEVPPGVPGELLYKVDEHDVKALFQGYFNDESSGEKKIIRHMRKHDDAWFRTGDLMRWDPEGRWWFVDRLGDTFRWKSENVSTSVVAQELGMHPAILEANVYGVQVPCHDGRAGCAAVTLGDSHHGDPAAKELLMAKLPTFLSTNLPKYSIPLFLRLVREMRQTGTLKQQKHLFRTEGLDLDKVEGEYGEEIWWLKGDRYSRFHREDLDRLIGGKVKL